ncbi:YegP family protein [Paenarthrobacter sp. NPDC056912]|uniref:YegP family protein n=1 Tax=Paenarthrobacter sp. NPDC056912 TaxID=3345965 RepID=UPI0036728289
MAGRFEILKNHNDDTYRFRLTAADGTVVAESPTFKHLKCAVDGINAVRENAATGLIVDRSTAAPKAA